MIKLKFQWKFIKVQYIQSNNNMVKAKDLQLGDIIFIEESADPMGGSYFMMMVVDKTDQELIVKDYSQDGKILKFSLKGSWETENTLKIKIGKHVKDEQLQYRRDNKINQIIE